jgi:hypothetical protein
VSVVGRRWLRRFNALRRSLRVGVCGSEAAMARSRGVSCSSEESSWEPVVDMSHRSEPDEDEDEDEGPVLSTRISEVSLTMRGDEVLESPQILMLAVGISLLARP